MKFLKFFLFLSIFTLSSCQHGLLYSHYKEPYFKQIKNHTEVSDKCYDSEVVRVHDPFFTSIYAEWGSLSPKDAIQKKDIYKVSFVDIEYTSTLFGLVKKEKIWVCGK